MYDVIIVGSGISGAFVARNLSKYDLKVLVIEKENDVANETTMANSAIVHSGYDPEPGTNKAKFNAKGNRMYEAICRELHVEFQQIGSLTVATSEEELETLKMLAERAIINEVPVELKTREQALEMEPNLSDETVGALYAPTAGIVYPWELAIGLMENAIDNGVELKLNQEVTKIEKIEKVEKIEKAGNTEKVEKEAAVYYQITTKNLMNDSVENQYLAKCVINAAGVYADQVHNFLSPARFKIQPRRGQYYVLDRLVGDHVKHVVFPCPSEKGKGVLVTPTTHGNILVGPNSEVIEDKAGIGTTITGLEFVKEHANRIVKNIPYQKVIRSFSGLRPSADVHDFVIEEVVGAPGFIDVAGIESPGLASAPAIAQEVERLVSNRLSLEVKTHYNPNRRPRVHFKSLSLEEKRALIAENHKYGQIVCRCETVTEAEIIDAIHRSAGATTIKGVKKRVRPGMGRCQGGFCEPLVIEILARELGIPWMDVLYDGPRSNILIEETKGETIDEKTKEAKDEGINLAGGAAHE